MQTMFIQNAPGQNGCGCHQQQQQNAEGVLLPDFIIENSSQPLDNMPLQLPGQRQENWIRNEAKQQDKSTQEGSEVILPDGRVVGQKGAIQNSGNVPYDTVPLAFDTKRWG